MGLRLKEQAGKHHVTTNLDDDEALAYVKRFKALDFDNKGYITINDLRSFFKVNLS